MRGLVVGHNLNATATVGRDLAADGIHTTSHHSLNPHDTLEHLRHANCDAVVFLCDGRARPPGAPSTPPTPPCPGFCLARQLRAQGNWVPLLVIAPRGSADTWTGCLDAGADAYISEPYEKPVLRARCRALIRRWSRRCSVGCPSQPHSETQTIGCGQPTPQPLASGKRDSILRVGDLTYDLLTDMVRRAGKVIELTPILLRLLKYLMRHAGKPCSRKDILQEVFGYQKDHESKVVEVNMNRLRKEVDAKFEIQLLHTVRGVGYKLAADG
jgi:DNA-binding response OmpR family regulator